MSLIVEQRLSLGQTLRTQGRILVALMLRDVRTRFFGSALGFLIAIGWPLSHIFILLAINTFIGRAAPYGDSAALWFATGLVPFMAFNYMSRFTMLGIALNRPLLNLPAVKVADILLARAILEILNAGVVVLAAMFIFSLMGIDFWPEDTIQASCALGACMLLGFGFGIINGIVAGLFPFWVTGFALFSLCMWIASGVLFVPDALPEAARYWLSYNPALVGVEWMRSAYYEGYGTGVLDKPYMLSFAISCLFLGLLLERLFRGRLLE
jgi:capsular polysaccharide transport system permease protein